MRLYAVRANKPGIGSSGDTALPFGYCWECEELFKVDIELEQLRPRRAELRPVTGRLIRPGGGQPGTRLAKTHGIESRSLYLGLGVFTRQF